MCRNKRLLTIVGLLLCLLMNGAQAARRTLAILLGDVESRPAVLAMNALREDMRAAGVDVRLILANGVTPEDRAFVRTADVAVLNVLARQLTQTMTPELQALRDAGRPVLGVGGSVDESLRALGVREDRLLQEYHRAGGVDNMTNLLRQVLRARFGAVVTPQPVTPMPESGLYDVHRDRTAASFDEYARGYAQLRPGAPWIGVPFYRASLVAGQTLPLAALAARLEAAGYNVLPVFGYPYETALNFFLDAAGRPRVNAIVALGMKVGATGATGALLERIGVPAINAITLSQQTVAQWEASRVGLDIIERTWQMAGAEFAGLVQPTVVASRERVTDAESGVSYVEERPIASRIERLTARVQAWVALRQTANADKRVALLYYNYPHGSETIGAAYLNVLPASLWQIIGRLGADGYRLSDGASAPPATPQALQSDIQQWGSHAGKSSREHRAHLARLAAAGEALRVPLATYRGWYGQLPAALREAVEKAWGPPERSPGLWRDAQGQAQFIFPARRHGNLLLAPQPTRAWEQHLEKLHNEVTLPPSHEYIAFYLWLQHGWGSHAVIHLGTHGTQEWLSGKEAGLSDADPTEALIGAMPNLYPYVMDDVGEGLQAKRRGMATIIDHMTPPFDAAGLNPDLRELSALLNDYRVAEQKSPLLARSHLTALNRLAGKSGVLKDMGKRSLQGEADLEALEEYLDAVNGKLTPFGLHTFGVPPADDLRQATARAVASLDKDLAPAERNARAAQIDADLLRSAGLELDRLMQALSGQYIPAGPSADLLRNPAALPTGRNFFGLDPSRIPSRTTYEEGAKLAARLVEDYRARHGGYPDRIAVNLWGVETSRHEGIMEAQVLALLGVRPTWDERGRVTGVEAIPRAKLGRPRVDVTMISSGLFRDLFPNVVKLLDEASRLAQREADGDNPLRRHTEAMNAELRRRGLPEADAERLAASRVFGLPSGAYGTNIEKLIPLSNAWRNEREVADVFINRMSHPFLGGQSPGDADIADESLRRELFRRALSGSRIALHSRSSNLFATLDNDDFFQYLGGTALAIRSIDGKTPEVRVSDLSNPRRPVQTTLEQYMGQELQSRYLNPRWAERMLREGYAGARFINRTVDYLWAWQVTVPEAVDDGKWQRMYDTYVADRHGLRVRERFAEAGNLRAFQAITDRMLSAIERGYWQAPPAVREHLMRENRRAIADAGVACGADSCSRASLQDAARAASAASAPVTGEAPLLTEAAPAQARPAADAPRPASARPSPGSAPATRTGTAPAAAQVSGFEMQSQTLTTPAQQTIGALALLLAASILAGIGYWRHAARRAAHTVNHAREQR